MVAVDAEGSPITEIALVEFEASSGNLRTEHVFKEEEEGRHVLGKAKRRDAKKVFKQYAKDGALFYSHAGTNYEDYCMQVWKVPGDQMIDTYKMLHTMFPHCRPGADGDDQGTFINTSLFFFSCFFFSYFFCLCNFQKLYSRRNNFNNFYFTVLYFIAILLLLIYRFHWFTSH